MLDTAVPFRDALRVWIRVAALSFGGPAGQIAVMHRILVEEKKWISEARFLHALNYCMLLPGPEAQQLATYVGWLLHGTRGGVVAGGLFILPGFVSILLLSILYVSFQNTPWLAAIFFGLKAAVLAIVLEAVFRIGRRAIRNGVMLSIAAAAFVAIFFFNAPFPFIIITVAVIGAIGGRLAPERFTIIGPNSGEAAVEAVETAAHPSATPARTARVAAIWLTIWLLPLAALVAFAGSTSVFSVQGIFFSKMAVVTFGGAYAVLAYVAQQAVEQHAWLYPGEMLDGLGMAETTPGPLIQVIQFVAFVGAWRHAGGLDPLVAGLVASIVATWAVFAPCFLWIFSGAPWIERLRGQREMTAALSAITAAVVGVILNLALWFGIHTMFAEVSTLHAGPLRVLIPDWRTIDPASALITAAAAVALVRFRVGMLPVLAASTAVGMLWYLSR